MKTMRGDKMPDPARATIGEVLHATEVHLKALRGRGGRPTAGTLADVAEGMAISIDKLLILLGREERGTPRHGDARRKDQGAAPDGPSGVTLRLVLDVRYEANGAGTEDLKRLLDGICDHAANEGLMTGGTAAEVVEWFARVEEAPGRVSGTAPDKGEIGPAKGVGR